MRACARDVGLLAIQAALVERCREEDLGAERKALLAALAAPGGRSVRDIAAGDACCLDAMLGAAGGNSSRSAAAACCPGVCQLHWPARKGPSL